MKTLCLLFWAFAPSYPITSQTLPLVIITEVMADPVPAEMLPPAEYIELFNPGPLKIGLLNWTISMGSRWVQLPDVFIEAGKYLIICRKGEETEFLNFGDVCAIDKMPAILNDGVWISLRNHKGQMIHAAEYNPAWFVSPFKQEGGWSLEMIDPSNPCGNKANWHESIDYNGGTPGRPNSMAGSMPDRSMPVLLRATVNDSVSITLHFSERMDSASLSPPSVYITSGGAGIPETVFPIPPAFNKVLVRYKLPFFENHVYSLSLAKGPCDCLQNPIATPAAARFALPAEPDSLDLVLNEVLFEASEQGEEFIEFYNRSPYTIDLAAVRLKKTDPTSGDQTGWVDLSETPYLVFPGSYIALTRSADNLACQHQVLNPANLLEIPSLFVLPDEACCLNLMDARGNSIDAFCYSAWQHSEMIRNRTEISLERCDPDGQSNDQDNWHSASALSGFATPGRENSQQCLGKNVPDVSVVQNRLSPNGDGFEDELIILYNFPKPGYLANMAIFNPGGNEVAVLAENLLLDTSGSLQWDGQTVRNHPAEPGVYVLWLEVFHPLGEVHKWKIAFSLIR